jgi:hypothetical protein
MGGQLIPDYTTSTVIKTFSSGAFALDMMRSTQNCFGVSKIRFNSLTGVDVLGNFKLEAILFPNPAQNKIELKSDASFSNIEILDFKGSLILETQEKSIDISRLPSGIYFARALTETGGLFTCKFVKN